MIAGQKQKSLWNSLSSLAAHLTRTQPYQKLLHDLGEVQLDPSKQVQKTFRCLEAKIQNLNVLEPIIKKVIPQKGQESKKSVVKTLNLLMTHLTDLSPYVELVKNFQELELPPQLQTYQPEGQKPQIELKDEFLPFRQQQKLVLEQENFIVEEAQSQPLIQNTLEKESNKSDAKSIEIVNEKVESKRESRLERQNSNPSFKAFEEPVSQEERVASKPVSQRQQRGRSSAQSRNIKGNSSEQDSVNFELTFKTKQTKNLSNTNRADSLIYSNATLLNSQQASFAPQARIKSHRSVLHKIDQVGAEESLGNIQRAVSREIDRSQKQVQKQVEVEERPRRQSQGSERGIFHTQIQDYKNKIARIKDIKQQKKQKLEAELRRVNQQIQGLVHKEVHSPSISKNHYESRVKISDNLEARLKAERLVKELRKEKKSRHEAQLGDLQAVDKNINFYMEELMRERYKNQERLKHRKKFQIIERMKQHEMRKIEDQKRKQKNIQFLVQLKQNNNISNSPNSKPTQPSLLPSTFEKLPEQPKRMPEESKKRSPTKGSEKSEFTPELSRKKEYLKKIRNLKFIKNKIDTYQQSLT